MNQQAERTLVIGFEGLSTEEAAALVPGVARDQWTSFPVDAGELGRDAFWWSVATGDSRRAMSIQIDGRVSRRPLWSVLDRMGRSSACVAWPRTFGSRIRDAAVVSDVACRVTGTTCDAWLCPPSVAWPTDVWERFRELRVHSEDITLEQVRELVPSLKANVPADAPLILALRAMLAAVSTVQAAAMDLINARAPESMFLWYGLGAEWPRSGLLANARPRALGFLHACVGFIRRALKPECVVVVTRDGLQLYAEQSADVHAWSRATPLRPWDAGATVFELLGAPTAADRDGRSASRNEPAAWSHDGVELASSVQKESP